MHLPFIASATSRWERKPAVLPIVVGSLSAEQHAAFARSLQPLFADPRTLFAVSTDFCHWGSRFRYSPYNPDAGPVYRSIENLDHEGMEALASRSADAFRTYIARTRNTICGRHALTILLECLAADGSGAHDLRWLSYAQSSKAMTLQDSSVSYAAGAVWTVPGRPGPAGEAAGEAAGGAAAAASS